MRRRKVLGGFLAGAALLAVSLILWESPGSHPRVEGRGVSSQPRAPRKVAVRKGADPAPIESGFRERLQKESAYIGGIDPDPARTQDRLSLWASELTKEDLQGLGKLALNAEVEADERALCVELLGLNRSDDALEALEQVVAAPVPQGGPERSVEFEVALRALSIEFMGRAGSTEARKRALAQVSKSQENAFLNDRIQRTLQHLRSPDTIASPDEQDRQALSQLLERSS